MQLFAPSTQRVFEALVGSGAEAIRRHAVVSMIATAENPVLLDLRPDWRLLAFITGATMLTSALFGLVPAVRASAQSQ